MVLNPPGSSIPGTKITLEVRNGTGWIVTYRVGQTTVYRRGFMTTVRTVDRKRGLLARDELTMNRDLELSRKRRLSFRREKRKPREGYARVLRESSVS